MKPTPVTSVVALALIAVASFVGGRFSAPGGGEASASGAATGAQTRLGTRGDGSAAATTGERAGRPGSRADGRGKAPQTGPKIADLEGIVRGNNALERTRAMLAFIDKLDPAQLEEAVASFRGLGLTQERMAEYSLLLTAWAEADPVKALAYATANTGGTFATNTILATWTAKDPEAAIGWATQNHSGTEANPYMASIIGIIAQTDVKRASQLIVDMPFSRERGEALAAMIPHLAALGPEAARSWVASLKDEQLREGAMGRLTDELASIDPQGTAKWLVANPDPTNQRKLGSAVAEWARQDLGGATAYFSSLPSGETRSYALRGLVSAVASEDPKGAAAMLNRYSGDVTDSVVRHFVWSSFGADPATAASNISRISDVEQRDETYRRTLGGWLRRDPEGAQTWLRSNQQLPPNVLDELNRQIREMNNGG